MSVRLSVEKGTRRAELRTADGTVQLRYEEHRFDPCQLERRKHRWAAGGVVKNRSTLHNVYYRLFREIDEYSILPC